MQKPLPWGNFGALHLGEGETYSGDFRQSRESARERWFPAGPVSKLALGGTAGAVPFHESVQKQTQPRPACPGLPLLH